MKRPSEYKANQLWMVENDPNLLYLIVQDQYDFSSLRRLWLNSGRVTVKVRKHPPKTHSYIGYDMFSNFGNLLKDKLNL